MKGFWSVWVVDPVAVAPAQGEIKMHLGLTHPHPACKEGVSHRKSLVGDRPNPNP